MSADQLMSHENTNKVYREYGENSFQFARRFTTSISDRDNRSRQLDISARLCNNSNAQYTMTINIWENREVKEKFMLREFLLRQLFMKILKIHEKIREKRLYKETTL